MVSVCFLLFVSSVACSESLYAIETSLTVTFYDFFFYKSIILPDGGKEKRIFEIERTFGDIQNFLLPPETTHVAVVYGEDERFITLSDSSHLPQFVGTLIVQFCGIICILPEIFVGGASLYSIKISGKGLSGKAYFETSLYKVDMGHIKDDGRYRIFNFPAFKSIDATVHSAGINIGLTKATEDIPTVVEEKDIVAMGYVSPDLRGNTGGIIMEVVIPEDFGNSSLVLFSLCGKTGAYKHCDMFHFIWRLERPPKRHVWRRIEKSTADTYYEVSAFKFENDLESVKMRWIYFGVAVFKKALLDKYDEIPCDNKRELRCSFIECTSYNKNCNNFGGGRTLRVSVKGNSINKHLIKINGRKNGYFQCKNIGKRKSCTGEVILPTNRKHEVEYAQCRVSLGRVKPNSYEMCGGGSKLITIVMEWLK